MSPSHDWHAFYVGSGLLSFPWEQPHLGKCNLDVLLTTLLSTLYPAYSTCHCPKAVLLKQMHKMGSEINKNADKMLSGCMLTISLQGGTYMKVINLRDRIRAKVSDST